MISSKSKGRNINISSIKWVSEAPADSQRDPATLYIIPIGVQRRDEALGAFLGGWSSLEGGLQSFLAKLLNTGFTSSGVVMASVSGIAGLIDLLGGLGELRLQKADQQTLAGLLDRLRKLNTKRNRIVHGRWTPEIVVGGDDLGRPEVASFEWTRVYQPASPAEFQKINDKRNQKVRAKYRFEINDVISNLRLVETLRVDFERLAVASLDRMLPPEQHK